MIKMTLNRSILTIFAVLIVSVICVLLHKPELDGAANVVSTQRRLQFDGMFEVKAGTKGRKKKAATKITRNQNLAKAVEEILLDADRYHMWWTGPPPDSDFFKPVDWSAGHNSDANAIFTMAVIQGHDDTASCSSPNDLVLYLGTARKYFSGDIVVALEADIVTDDVKAILQHYKATVYLLPKDLCSKATRSIFCGSEEERVPASVFRYYFYEKWATLYKTTSFIMLSDFRDILFQGNPFEFHLEEWYPEYQLVVFQEFHPNMVINRCSFNKKIMAECFGEESLRIFGNRVIISSGAIQGTRDAIILWTHHMTLQIQEAPGRMVETRCASGGIDHSFINWLVYGNKLRQMVRIRIFPHGEGAVNTLGGLRPNTVVANISGDIQSFWKVLDDSGHVLNWNGEVSPVVHQLDHFQQELILIADSLIDKAFISYTGNKNDDKGRIDRAWQAIASSRCLFDCSTSPKYTLQQN